MPRHKTPNLKTLYHFTSLDHLPWILRDGVLKTTESNVGSPLRTMPPYGQHVGPDVVWLLNTPNLEYTHGLDGSNHEKSAVRFTVKARATRWINWEPQRRMDPEWRRSFVYRGGGVRASRQWFVSQTPIDRRSWVAIDVMQNGAWFPIAMELPKEAVR